VGHSSSVWDASFDRAGKRVLTASLDGTARIWDAASGKELMRLQSAKTNGLLSAQFDPDERLVVAVAMDGRAILWDLQSGQEIAALPGETQGLFGSAEFSPDGTRILLAHGEAPPRIFDVTWAAKVRGDTLRERVCAEKLVGPAQEFTDAELANPILRGIDRDDPIGRNPCLRRGPLSLDYWARLPARWRR
jgi:WD40 repeat protein